MGPVSQSNPEPGPGRGPAPAAPAGRYERSFSGLVAAMIVLVVFVLAVVGYRELFRSDLDVEPTAVDYREAGEAVAGAGIPVVLPVELPAGWVATSAELERGRSPVWRLGVLTADERFVGLRQGEAGAERLLEQTYPDEDAAATGDVTVPGAEVETSWQAWQVGEDLAWAADVGGTTVLVHGSAPAEDLRTFVTTLEELAASPGQTPQEPSSSSTASSR